MFDALAIRSFLRYHTQAFDQDPVFKANQSEEKTS